MNSSSHTGAAAELAACYYFMNAGLEVMRNVAPAGPVDLVVYNKLNGKMLAVDIKSSKQGGYVNRSGELSFLKTVRWREDGVAQVVYIHEQQQFYLPDGFWESLGIKQDISD